MWKLATLVFTEFSGFLLCPRDLISLNVNVIWSEYNSSWRKAVGRLAASLLHSSSILLFCACTSCTQRCEQLLYSGGSRGRMRGCIPHQHFARYETISEWLYFCQHCEYDLGKSILIVPNTIAHKNVLPSSSFRPWVIFIFLSWYSLMFYVKLFLFWTSLVGHRFFPLRVIQRGCPHNFPF